MGMNNNERTKDGEGLKSSQGIRQYLQDLPTALPYRELP